MWRSFEIHDYFLIICQETLLHLLSTISWSYFIYRSICQRLTLGWLGVVITPRNMHFWTSKMELFNHIFSQSQHILVISSINGHFAIFGNLLKFIAIFRNFIIILMKGPKSTFCRRAPTEFLSAACYSMV